MNIEQLLTDQGIPIAPSGHKHFNESWVNVKCPFCEGHDGFHLGFSQNGKMSNCYRCGLHYVDDSIAKVLKIPLNAAKSLLLSYTGIHSNNTKEKVAKTNAKAHKLPDCVTQLTNAHKKYLTGRNFDGDKLENEWRLMSTGPISMLDDINYGHRILAPIYWEGQQVTFQTRDATGKSRVKYMACPEEREIMKHKHILYRHPDIKSKVGICVEGITDVWRFGEIAFATFGIEYTNQQVRWIAKLYKRVGVCFDDEPQAVQKANDLVGDLKFRGVDAFRIDIKGDPGGLPQHEANQIIKNL